MITYLEGTPYAHQSYEMDGNAMRQIRHKAFAKEMHSQLQKSNNSRLKELTESDIQKFISLFWEVMAMYLYDGHRVIFEGWASFYTNPVKRKCHEVGHRGYKWSFKRRLRFRPLDNFRESAEVEMTEEEYELHKSSKTQSDKK